MVCLWVKGLDDVVTAEDVNAALSNKANRAAELMRCKDIERGYSTMPSCNSKNICGRRVLFVAFVVASEALPFMGPLEANLGLDAFDEGLGPLEEIGAGFGSELNNIIQSSIAMDLNGAGAMNAGLLAAQNGLGYALNGGVNGLLGGMALGALGAGMGLEDAI
ncbi:unnamed protein product [Pieris macdunnoughi]|uniref:Uncharacterized protein n=1 Tax=Pieris macdunnoughi TaxID=345717 RepID=A0A821V8Y7_9NEOP|nr:unnamed protein product [Pieris macdunnoughi]